jgi:hypothetical protein
VDDAVLRRRKNNRRSFDCVTRTASYFAQDDRLLGWEECVKDSDSNDRSRSLPDDEQEGQRRNTGILHCVQDDDVKNLGGSGGLYMARITLYRDDL